MCLALRWGFTHPCFHLRSCPSNAGVLYSRARGEKESESLGLCQSHTQELEQSLTRVSWAQWLRPAPDRQSQVEGGGGSRAWPEALPALPGSRLLPWAA